MPVGVQSSSDPAGCDLVINASPLGLNGDDPLPFDPARVDANAAVIDILMKQRTTPLLRACAARGVPAWPGFEMMTQQAALYLDFFGLHRIAQAMQEDASEVRELLQAR